MSRQPCGRTSRIGRAGAGEIGESLRGWAKNVERTGGDPETLAAQMVTWLIDHPELNGTFLLPEEWYILRQRGEP